MHVVDDLMTDVDGRAVPFEQLLDDVDRPHDAGAEASRGSDEDLPAHRSAAAARSRRPIARRALSAVRSDTTGWRIKARATALHFVLPSTLAANARRPTGSSHVSETARTTPVR